MRVSERLRARVERDFEPGSAEAALATLDGLDLPLVAADDARERIQAAIVFLADGDLARLKQEAGAAELDWRDVLVSGGLENDDWRSRLDRQLGRQGS